jgi:hypothetical protein
MSESAYVELPDRSQTASFEPAAGGAVLNSVLNQHEIASTANRRICGTPCSPARRLGPNAS